MSKTLLLAAAMMVGASALTGSPGTAAAKSVCEARAEALYPFDRKVRKAYRKACKERHRAWRKGARRGIWWRPY